MCCLSFLISLIVLRGRLAVAANLPVRDHASSHWARADQDAIAAVRSAAVGARSVAVPVQNVVMVALHAAVRSAAVGARSVAVPVQNVVAVALHAVADHAAVAVQSVAVVHNVAPALNAEWVGHIFAHVDQGGAVVHDVVPALSAEWVGHIFAQVDQGETPDGRFFRAAQVAQRVPRRRFALAASHDLFRGRSVQAVPSFQGGPDDLLAIHFQWWAV